MEKQRHVDLEAQVQQLCTELTDQPPAHAPPPQKLEEGVLDVADCQMTMQSCGPGAATIALRLSARVAQLAEALLQLACCDNGCFLRLIVRLLQALFSSCTCIWGLL